MKNIINNRTYDISDITVNYNCDCEFVCKPDLDGIVNVCHIPGYACYEDKQIKIDNVTIIYDSVGGFDVIEGDINSIILPTGYNISDFLEALLPPEKYAVLISDKTPHIEEIHQDKTIATVLQYIHDNNLVPYLDTLRGFYNEWRIILAPQEAKLSYRQLNIQEVTNLLRASFDYQYNRTCLQLY